MSEQSSISPKDQGHRSLLILLFVGFVLSGIATVIVGPMLPEFKQRWSLDDSQLGLFSTVQFLAALAGTLASGAIASWRGYRPALVIGYALMGVGLAGLNSDARLLAMVATGVFGLGYGLLTPGTNLFVAELGGAQSASLLNRLNFMWGVGATVCPLLIAFALKQGALRILLTSFAVFGGLMVVGLLRVSFGSETHKADPRTTETQGTGPGLAVTIAMAVLFFGYVAMETSTGGWSAEYAKRLAGAMTGLTTMAPTFFYAALTSGRGLAPLVLRRWSERKLVLFALILSAAGTLFLVESTTLKGALAALFLAGLGCASIYPTYISWLSKWYGVRAKHIGGILFALASLGGSAGPLLVGVVSQHAGSLRIGLLAPVVAAVVMFGIVLLLRKQTTA